MRYSLFSTSLRSLVSGTQLDISTYINIYKNSYKAVMTIRLHAMYGRSRKILAFMILFWISGISVAAVSDPYNIYNATYRLIFFL